MEPRGKLAETFHHGPKLSAACAGFMVLSALSGCLPPGTEVRVDRTGVAQMQRLGVSVIQDDEFSVILAREPFLPNVVAGAGLLGLIVLVGATAGRSSADAEYAALLKPVVGTYDPGRRFADGLMRNLRREQAFPAVVNVQAEEKSAMQEGRLDGIAEFTLKQWGLRRCSAPSADEKVQAAVYLEGRIVSVARGDTVWERREFYLDGQCHALEELRSRDGLLISTLSRVIDHLSGKMAHEIRFP